MEISFGILNLGVPEEEARKEVEQVIETLEIEPFRHKPTHALSGGPKETGIHCGYSGHASGDYYTG